MCKGSTTTTSASQPDPQAYAAYSALLGQAAGVAATPYQSYGGQLVAPVNTEQQAGISNINNAFGMAQPAIGTAEGLVGTGVNAMTAASSPITPSQIEQYESPYTSQVVNATEAQFNNQNAAQQSQLTGNAAAQGALGGTSVEKAQAMLAGQQQLSEAPTIAGLENQGYTTALSTAEQEQQAAMAGANYDTNAAFALGNLGVAGQNAALQGATSQISAGTLEQQTQQAQDTAAYQQFLNQQAYPFQTASWLAGIDTGVGSQMGGTSETTAPPPNPLNTILGLGVLGAGLFSDRRLKTDVARIGETKDGQNIYRFRYKDDPSGTWQIGFMADEVERHHPDAVSTTPLGLRAVDYGRATDDAVHERAWGGGIPLGLAAGGVPTTPYAGGSSYVPFIQITPGKGPPAPPAPQTQPSPLQTLSQISGLTKNLGISGSSGSSSSSNASGGRVWPLGLAAGGSPNDMPFSNIDMPFTIDTSGSQSDPVAHGPGAPNPPAAVKPDNPVADVASALGSAKNLGLFGSSKNQNQNQSGNWRGGAIGLASGGTSTYSPATWLTDYSQGLAPAGGPGSGKGLSSISMGMNAGDQWSDDQINGLPGLSSRGGRVLWRHPRLAGFATGGMVLPHFDDGGTLSDDADVTRIAPGPAELRDDRRIDTPEVTSIAPGPAELRGLRVDSPEVTSIAPGPARLRDDAAPVTGLAADAGADLVGPGMLVPPLRDADAVPMPRPRPGRVDTPEVTEAYGPALPPGGLTSAPDAASGIAPVTSTPAAAAPASPWSTSAQPLMAQPAADWLQRRFGDEWRSSISEESVRGRTLGDWLANNPTPGPYVSDRAAVGQALRADGMTDADVQTILRSQRQRYPAIAAQQSSPSPGDATVGPGGRPGVTPRGIRNNNPGNIEDGNFARSLPGYAGSDGRFAQFDTPEAGHAAQVALLGRYGGQGIDTVSGVISRWAPSSDGNDVGAYAGYVARRLGISPTERIDLNDPQVASRVADAMAEFENGTGGGGGGTAGAGGERLGLRTSSQPGGGLTAAQPQTDIFDRMNFLGWTPEHRNALIAAGLRMMVPNPQLNLGAAGIAGLETAQGMEQQRLGLSRDDRNYQLNLMKEQEAERHNRATEESGKFSMIPGWSSDPSDPTKQIPGVWVFDAKTGIPQFHTNMGITPKGAAGAGTQLSPPALEIKARQLLNGDLSAKQNVGRGTQGDAVLKEIDNKAADLLTDPNGDYRYSPQQAAEYLANANQEFAANRAGRVAGARTVSQREANVSVILSKLDADIPSALEASDRVGRTGFVPVNQAIQYFQRMGSSSDLGKFGMANLTLAEAWARSMNPTGVMRESDRDMALQFLSTATSPEMYRQVVGQLRSQVERERDALRGMRSSGTGGGPPVPGGAARTPAAAPPSGSAGAAAPAVGRGGLPIVSSPDEARRLPSGTHFLTPDGREKVVP